MKIIHCSDVHLGASMTTHLNFEQAIQRRDELLHSFFKLVEYAVKNEISVILIAGDLLDTEYADSKTTGILLDIFRAHPEIDFYYLSGNHDEDNLILHSASSVDNLHIFGSDWTSFYFNGIRLTGAVLGEHNASLYSKLTLDPTEFNIVMLHGDEVHGRDYDTPDTVNFDALKNKNIDYLALGHLHSYHEGALDKRGTYCYSGCLEGRGFDECGPKGFVLLEINENGETHKFVPFASRQLHEVEIDISELSTLPEFVQALEQKLSDIPSQDFVRVVFVGTYDENSRKNLKISTMSFRDKFYYFEFKDKTKMQINLDDLEHDISLRGEFVRTVRASGLSRQEQDDIIYLGLATLNGEEVN